MFFILCLILLQKFVFLSFLLKYPRSFSLSCDTCLTSFSNFSFFQKFLYFHSLIIYVLQFLSAPYFHLSRHSSVLHLFVCLSSLFFFFPLEVEESHQIKLSFTTPPKDLILTLLHLHQGICVHLTSVATVSSAAATWSLISLKLHANLTDPDFPVRGKETYGVERATAPVSYAGKIFHITVRGDYFSLARHSRFCNQIPARKGGTNERKTPMKRGTRDTSHLPNAKPQEVRTGDAMQFRNWKLTFSLDLSSRDGSGPSADSTMETLSLLLLMLGISLQVTFLYSS
ncbi:unnamed protein product [Acanthosepion pharaonis]|uniref:Uncharacterized protein n=1 Tax=Acanthosepion pharaonis TaxID=158019 RepID=A0A812D4T7_ACAPH|nr:unnamed protein product [Sepia pharaonis]